MIVLSTLLVIPFALMSMVDDVTRQNETHLLQESHAGNDQRGAILVEVVKVDEVSNEVTLRISGLFHCSLCTSDKQFTFYSVPAPRPDFEGIPPARHVKFPIGGQVAMEEITLPLRGSLFRYPFDTYPLTLGIGLEQASQGMASTAQSSQGAEGPLTIAVRNGASRLHMASPTALNMAGSLSSEAKDRYLGVYNLTLSRPFYLKIVIPLVVLLIAAAAALAVLLRPFDQLVLNSGGLVLGVWGVRGLVLGGFPPNVTLVDQALTGIIVLILVAIACRAMTHLHDFAELSILPRTRH